MADPRIQKLAELVVKYSTKIKSGNKVVINAPVAAQPLTRAIYTEVVKAGGFPIVLPRGDFEDILYRFGTDEQIQYVHQPQRYIAEEYDARFAVLADDNTKKLSNVAPEKMVLFDRGRSGLMKTMMKRSGTGEFNWVVVPFPTAAMAQDAEMSLEEYEDFVFGACMPDLDDPIGYWLKQSDRLQKVVDWLKGRREVHVTAPGTDLKLSIKGRKFVKCDGQYNMPDGEVFTGPVEDSANGHVYFSYPAIESGREVTGVRLWFENGKVVKATAEKNEEFLLKTLDTDEGARRLGEFAIGTNEGITRFTGEILFDEKIGGSFHMALGAGYPETGSVNESAIHWDMVCDLRQGGEIRVDGDLLYKDGKFVIDF
ncbi:aminopeptidase [Dehalogenimonas etheniformans]|uniref:Aminopeptidase n=1 Tax=Dehalogenimonas etheniformans TaxID=1536648 RepID=A0A2P5P5P6_9CHLR|nr:aminopeptidase [Dehalogenimonas etheniformans]PPD57613.1 aminopeptidase [Dehalogenimonas etheniformans]QNT75953.1 aminopeptidase [Dehalogenimonas etheniformans]